MFLKNNKTSILFSLIGLMMFLCMPAYSHVDAQTIPTITGKLWAHYSSESYGGASVKWCNSRLEVPDSMNLTTEYLGFGGPGTGCGDDEFHTTWVGHLYIPVAGTYNFRIQTSLVEQVTSFTIDGQGWFASDDNSSVMYPGKDIPFGTPGWKRLTMVVQNGDGGAFPIDGSARLMWTPPASPEVVVPSANLSPEAGEDLVVKIPAVGPKLPVNFKVTGVSSEEDLLIPRIRQFSISAWIKTDEDGTIVYADANSNLFTDKLHLRMIGGKAQLDISANGFAITATSNGSANENNDNWHHVVGVRETEYLTRIYVDGIERGSGSSATKLSSIRSDEWQIGAKGTPSGLSDYFDGKIDDVRVYNRVLQPSEISALFNNVNAPTIGLVGHWKFDEAGNSATAISSTRHHYDGILSAGLEDERSGDTPSVFGGRSLDFDASDLEYVKIAGNPITDKVVNINLDTQVLTDPSYSILQNEVLAMWASKDINIQVNGSPIVGQPIRFHDGSIIGAYARLPSSMIPVNGVLNLVFSNMPNLTEGGITVIVPYLDPLLPNGRLSLYVSVGSVSYYEGPTPSVVFPVQNLTTIDPIIIIYSGETGYTAPYKFRPNYSVYKSGLSWTSAPSRFEVLAESGDVHKNNEENIKPRSQVLWFMDSLFQKLKVFAAAPSKFDILDDGSASVMRLYPQASGPITLPISGSNALTWYSAFGRNGLNLDILSPNYSMNNFTAGETFGNSNVPPISVPGGTQWVAMQLYSSNFPQDDPIGGRPESLGFTTAIGVLSDLDIAEPPGSLPYPSMIDASRVSCPGTAINVTWNEPADTTDITEYHIFRCVSAGVCDPSIVGTEMGTTPKGSSFFSDSAGPFTVGMNYYYTVRSHDHLNVIYSAFASPAVSETYPACPPPPINANISATPIRVQKGQSTTLTWSSNTSVPLLSCEITDNVTPDLINLSMAPCAASPFNCNGSQLVGPLTQDTQFTIRCLPVDTTEQDAVSVSTSVLIFRER